MHHNADTRGFVAELAAKSIDQASLGRPLSEENKEKLRVFWRGFGDLDERLSYRGSIRAGFREWPAAGTTEGQRYDQLELQKLFEADFWSKLHEHEESPVMVPTSIEAYGDTKTQAISVFTKIQKLLADQSLGLGDIVKLTVYLVGDPKNGGKLDFKGFSEAYSQFFGTPTQPNIVTRTTLQVVALANPGFLVEIEATAATAATATKQAAGHQAQH